MDYFVLQSAGSLLSARKKVFLSEHPFYVTDGKHGMFLDKNLVRAVAHGLSPNISVVRHHQKVTMIPDGFLRGNKCTLEINPAPTIKPPPLNDNH